MKKYIFIATLFFSNLGYGQIAVIKDADGYTNVRKQPNSDSEIIYKLKDSEVFSYEVSKSDWVTVYISKNKFHLQCEGDNILAGYIHKSRLCPIEDLNVYSGTDFSFKYILKKFSLENKVPDYNGKWLTKINGRRIYGADGNIPKIEISGIDVQINGKTIEIPDILFQDIFECSNEFTINENKEDFIVHQWNSDGAGGYLIIWVLGREKLKQRLILIP